MAYRVKNCFDAVEMYSGVSVLYRFREESVKTLTQPANLRILYCDFIINSISRSQSTHLSNIDITLIKVTMVCAMYLNSLLPLFFLAMYLCFVTL